MKILVSALEFSANLHLKEILKYQNNKLELFGIFDKFLSDNKPLYDLREFSIMGFVDVLSKILKSYKAIKELALLSKDVDKVLLIDSPAFNIPLAKKIKKINPDIEIIYYILPKVWAWRKNRIKKIEKYCDKLISIFPFEDKFYSNSVYLGNPLLDEIQEYKQDIKETGYIAFLAGSRKSEIKCLMPLFRELNKEINTKAILVIPKEFEDLSIYGDIAEFEISYDTKEALLRSDFAFICSGTATLEAAIIGTPFILTYKANNLDYFIAKRFVHLKHIGLANIIFDFYNRGEFHPEFIQRGLTKENLLHNYQNTDRNKFINNSLKLREILKKGSSRELAELLSH
ncbi:MAG: lipid-A-disaccharide synthase [Desulfobacteraceae bacterium 4484_190.3]|nr:MAG: lipid-A-disaccharide synthase [Desulfobacteraceae bacterium 4484_190.3]